MKKIFICLGLMLGILSCDDNLSELNIDPKEPNAVTPEVLFTYGQFNLVKQLVNAEYNFNVDRFWANYLTQTTYIQEASYDAANRDVGGAIWDNIYTECLFELSKAKQSLRADIVPGTEAEVDNKLAMIKVLEVFAYQYLVDNFGDIPFTEALNPDNVVPAYDEAQFVYGAITDSLQWAIAAFDPTAEGFSESADLLYGGDIGQWQKFANSLLLKIGIRLADVDPTTASALVNDAVAGGVFQSNADNADLQFSETQPYTNPVWEYFEVQNRDTDFVVTQFFIDLLQGLDDPRMDPYFDENIEAGYVGGVYGGVGNAYGNLTHIDPVLVEPDFPGTILDYSFVAFTLAEAVERNFISGDAAEFYEEGIRASFEAWGLTDADATAYISQPEVAYATAAGDWRQKIGTQKYIALYNQGHEAWTEARRLDYPALLPAASTGKENPKRMIYPTTEDLVNPTNYDAAIARMGPDVTETPLFWDVD